MSPVVVRPAAPGDAGAIALIYNQGIEDRLATFETDPRDEAGMLAYLGEREGRYPVLVLEADGAVVAWAGTGPYQPRRCYDGVASVSVYVERSQRGAGLGVTALNAVAQACEAAGFWKLWSLVFPENGPSRRMCARAGFQEVGIHRRHSRLDGRWRDCVIVERLLGDALSDP